MSYSMIFFKINCSGYLENILVLVEDYMQQEWEAQSLIRNAGRCYNNGC